MAVTFDTTDYEDIRKSIDVSLSASTLPNSVIASDLYAGAAIETIESAVSALESDQLTTYAARIKRAAKMLTAAYICPAVPAISSETLETDRIDFQNRDLKALAKRLEDRAFDAVQRILNDATATPLPVSSDFAAGLFTSAKCNAK